MTQFESILAQLGDVAQRMAAINAAEGAAGNVSVWLRALDGVPDLFASQDLFANQDLFASQDLFANQDLFTLPETVPALVGGWLLVSGAGRRLRDLAGEPATTLCVLQIQNATTATLHAAPGVRPTSELNSHLLTHNAYLAEHRVAQHAVLHAQPPYLTYLSHMLPPNTDLFNKRLLRWQPETVITFPHGLAVLPFQVPGSHAQATTTAQAMRRHTAVVWARHGVVVRDPDVRHAADLIEYAEAAAHYEYLNLQAGEPSSGLSDDELRRMCQELGIEQTVF